MKILYVVHGFPPRAHTGTESYTYHLARSMSAKNDVCAFYLYRDGNRPPYAVERGEMNGVKCCGVNYDVMTDATRFRDTYRNPRLNNIFKKCLEEFRPDVVHFTYLLAGLSIEFVELAKEAGAKAVVTLTDFLPLCLRGQLLDYRGNVCAGPETDYKCSECVWMVRRMRKGLMETVRLGLLHIGPVAYLARRVIARMISGRRRSVRKALKAADVIITPTLALREQYLKWGPQRGDMLHLGYGIDAKPFVGFTRSDSDVIRFGFIGQALPHKGLHVLLEAGEMLKGGRFRIVVFAGTDLPGSREYVDGLGDLMSHEHVSWRGTFPFDKIAQAYAEFDVLVVPSLWYENSPLVLLYARESRTPLIVSNFGGLTESVREGETGLIFEPGNAKALAGAMKRFIESPALCAEMAEKIKPPPSSDEHAERIVKIYNGLTR